MGTFTVRLEVSDKEQSRSEVVETLVDAGATYTVLPRQLLERLGVVPHTRGRFELADGSEVELDLGRAWVRLNGHEEYTMVVFGEDALLGAVTLEELRLAPDPAGRRLLPVPALLKRLAA